MKVLSINKFFHIYGGCERYMFELNRLLESDGHSVIHFAMSHPDNEESPYSKFFVSNVNFFKSPNLVNRLKGAGRVIYSFEARRKLDALLLAEKPDIAHLHNIAHQLSPSILATLQKHGVPIVQTLHDYKLVCPVYTMYQHGSICEKCRSGNYYHVVKNRCNHGSVIASGVNCAEMYLHKFLGSYTAIDQFIAPSIFLYNKVAESGIDSQRLKQLSYFIDSNGVIPTWDHEGYFLFFGQLISVKGIDILLEAARRAPQIRLVVAGKGEQQVELQEFAIQHNLDVKFVGFQSGKNLERLIQGAMAVVVPSKWYENQPFAILEAFTHGKPVVASRLGGMIELVEDQMHGLLFEPNDPKDLADKLCWIQQNQSMLQYWGRLAREKIEKKFSPSQHLATILEIYRKLIEKR